MQKPKRPNTNDIVDLIVNPTPENSRLNVFGYAFK